jgi:peroxiredoxin Q/BCP
VRSTVVVAEDGTIEHAFFRVKATGHVDDLLEAMGLAAR